MFAVLYNDLVELEMSSQWSVRACGNFSQPKQNACTIKIAVEQHAVSTRSNFVGITSEIKTLKGRCSIAIT